MAMSEAGMSNRETRNQQATCWIGGIEPQCTEEILWELMVQAAPVASLHMPKDKITQIHQGYAFCEFASPEDADYAVRIINNIKLYGKQLKMNKAQADSNKEEEGLGFSANLFVGNLDPDVDEKLLFDTFSAFGAVVSCKVVTDPETGQSRGFAFLTFDSFESGDAALEGMAGQYLANRPVHASYGFKKDGAPGERHGSAAERLLEKEAGLKNIRPKAPAISMENGPFKARGPAVGMGRGNVPNMPNMPPRNMPPRPGQSGLPPPPPTAGYQPPPPNMPQPPAPNSQSMLRLEAPQMPPPPPFPGMSNMSNMRPPPFMGQFGFPPGFNPTQPPPAPSSSAQPPPPPTSGGAQPPPPPSAPPGLPQGLPQMGFPPGGMGMGMPPRPPMFFPPMGGMGFPSGGMGMMRPPMFFPPQMQGMQGMGMPPQMGGSGMPPQMGGMGMLPFPGAGAGAARPPPPPTPPTPPTPAS